jgi:hypothetical protein
VQRERRGQHQLIVNWEDSNLRLSNGSRNSNQCFVKFRVKHKLLEGKQEYKGYEMEFYSVGTVFHGAQTFLNSWERL